MRHARNLAFFLLGVLLSVALVVPVYAGAVKVQPKNWYGSNTGGVTKGFNGSTPAGPWSSNDGVWSPPTYKSNGSFKKNGLDIPFSANQDYYPKDLYPGLKQGASGGFKGLAKGSLGLGPILGGLALTWAMQQGFEWMDELKCQAQVSCWQKKTSYPEFYSATHDLRIEAKTIPRTRLKIYSNTKCCTPEILADLNGWCKQYGYTGAHPSVPTACQTPGYGTVDYFYNIDQIGSATPNGVVPSSVTPVADAAVQTALEQAATANFPTWFKAAVDDDMIIEIEEDRPVVPGVAQPVTAPATVSTSTETRPDGSTVAKTQTAADTYTVRCIVGADAACTALDPWQITEGKTVTEQTTTCTQAGTCETSVKTEEETSPQPEKTPRQELCESNPKALECLDVGEMPEDQDLPKSEVKMQFGWQPFSLPSTCPQPQPVELMGQTYFYDWSMTCDFAEKIKPFMLITAFITAYFIIMGARRNESN